MFFLPDPNVVQPPEEKMYGKCLALQRHSGEHLGYGSFGQNLAKGLKSLGVNFWEPATPDDYWEVPKGYKTVVHATLPNHTKGSWKNQVAVAYTMWESDHIPPVFIENLHNFDIVIVPNDDNVARFLPHHDNVHKVPLGYNSTFWHKRDTREYPKDFFNFLWCGAGMGSGSRKGPELAIQGFLNAFPKWEQMSPQPHLIMKSLLGSNPAVGEFATVYSLQMSLEDLRELYFNAHAMVLPSRGEGWGYHPQQALATGMPVILSDIPGHSEYHWLPGFWVVPTQKTKAAYFLQGDAGNWWDPDLDSITEGYLSIYNNYKQWRTEAEQGAVQMARLYSHYEMARKMCHTIGPENLVQCKTGRWQEFSIRKHLVRTTRHIMPGECSIGGERYVLSAETDYWLPANVRLVLDEAGYLENGLTERGRIDVCPHRPELLKCPTTA